MHYKTVYNAYARSTDLVHTKNLSKGKKRSWQSTQADEPGRVIIDLHKDPLEKKA